MSNSTKLTDAVDVCPGCQTEYKDLARHWASSPDHRPDLDYVQLCVCAGLSLSGVTVDETTNAARIETRTEHLGFAVWVAEQLDWLAGDIYHYDTAEYGGTRDTYIVRTVAHPELRSFARWRSESGRPGAAQTLPGLFGLRTFVARSGSASWGGPNRGQRQLKFYAGDEAERAWYADVLDHFGFSPNRSGAELYVSPVPTRELLESIGPPVPGVEHKWALDRDDYDKLRRDQWIRQLETEDATLREGALGESPSAWRRHYSEREMVCALRRAHDDIYNGDSAQPLSSPDYKQWRDGQPGRWPSISVYQHTDTWNTWKQLAGLTPTGRQSYTVGAAVGAIRRCAGEVGEPLERQDYADWARGRATAPSETTMQRLFSDGFGWDDICNRAGVETTHVKHETSDIVSAVVEAMDELGYDLTLSDYSDWSASEDAPSSSTITNRIGWNEAKGRARSRLADSPSNE